MVVSCWGTAVAASSFFKNRVNILLMQAGTSEMRNKNITQTHARKRKNGWK
jgi:hypothetical protein